MEEVKHTGKDDSFLPFKGQAINFATEKNLKANHNVTHLALRELIVVKATNSSYLSLNER